MSEFHDPAGIIRYLPLIIITLFFLLIIIGMVNIVGQQTENVSWTGPIIIIIIIILLAWFFYWLCVSGYILTAWFLLIFITLLIIGLLIIGVLFSNA